MNIYKLYQNYIIKPKVSPSPTPYTDVDYIQSTGTQYIVTDIAARWGFMVEAKFRIYNDSYSQIIIGGKYEYASAVYIGADLSAGQFWSFYQWHSWSTPSNIINSGDLYEIKSQINSYFNGIRMWVNDDLLIDTEDTIGAISTSKFGIFARIDGTSPSYIKLYKLKIYQIASNYIDLTLKNDFQPVYNKNLHEYGLYDKVNDVYYGNAGTGSFLGGNE